MRTPTQSDRADFAGFCRDASDRQLREIYRKERGANRLAYADLAKEEARRRGVDLD